MAIRRILRILLMLLALQATHRSAAAAELAADSRFEGGSAKVEGIDQQNAVIRFKPGGDPQRGWPCWWATRPRT